MHIVTADIDEILKETEELANYTCSWVLKNIEIDLLLEETKDWN